MSTDSKSSRIKKLKAQALEHWLENKRLLKNMDWEDWCRETHDFRYYALLTNGLPAYPSIHGTDCAFCQYYTECCKHIDEKLPFEMVRTNERVQFREKHSEKCPLAPEVYTGACCPEWKAVKKALLYPTTKSYATRCVNAMIKRIEEIPDGNDTI